MVLGFFLPFFRDKQKPPAASSVLVGEQNAFGPGV